jgi:hypothetical protein
VWRCRTGCPRAAAAESLYDPASAVWRLLLALAELLLNGIQVQSVTVWKARGRGPPLALRPVGQLGQRLGQLPRYRVGAPPRAMGHSSYTVSLHVRQCQARVSVPLPGLGQ